MWKNLTSQWVSGQRGMSSGQIKVFQLQIAGACGKGLPETQKGIHQQFNKKHKKHYLIIFTTKGHLDNAYKVTYQFRQLKWSGRAKPTQLNPTKNHALPHLEWNQVPKRTSATATIFNSGSDPDTVIPH